MTGNIEIRPMLKQDEAPVMRILEDTGMFTPAEIEVAAELIGIYLNKPEQKDYTIYTAVDKNDSAVSGYVCFGPTPATESTFDLYWIAVAPAKQRYGIGKALLNFTERETYKKGGRLMIIETSSREKYAPTQNFYLRNGYTVEARIKDFYAEGDDRLIFTRRFSKDYE